MFALLIANDKQLIALHMRNFKALMIWQKGYQIAINCFKLTATFPGQEKYGLVSQLNRACISIPSNIAEGSSRRTNKNYNHFIQIALGSCFEAETQLLIAQELKIGNAEFINEILLLITEEEKMLTAFSKTLLSNS
jgi:four helix bundle protein